MPHRLTRSILLLLFGAFLGAPALSAQTRTVTGKVTELGGEVAVVSALINLEGTTTHTYSNDEGNFSLELPAGEQRLTVQIIGYRSTEVTVGADETTITIELARDVLNLDEIVVTGQATGIRRQNLANAVATVSSEDLTRAPLASFEQALQGRLAGANVQANNGAPGGGIQVQLRGTSSIIGDHRPLYVVDGVVVSNDEIASNVHVVTVSSSNPVRGGQQDNAPNRIADLNPNDIESIEVLKGASASAIYGSKATNGVVLITTKRGRVGAPRFNFTQRLGFFQKANDLGLRRFDTVDDAVEAFGPNAANFYSSGAFFDHEEYLAGNTPLSYESALSVNGGNESTRYYVSGLVKHDGGIVTGTGYDKQSLKLNVDQSIGSSVLFRISTTALHTKTARGFTNNDNRSISYWMTLPVHAVVHRPAPARRRQLAPQSLRQQQHPRNGGQRRQRRGRVPFHRGGEPVVGRLRLGWPLASVRGQRGRRLLHAAEHDLQPSGAPVRARRRAAGHLGEGRRGQPLRQRQHERDPYLHPRPLQVDVLGGAPVRGARSRHLADRRQESRGRALQRRRRDRSRREAAAAAGEGLRLLRTGGIPAGRPAPPHRRDPCRPEQQQRRALFALLLPQGRGVLPLSGTLSRDRGRTQAARGLRPVGEPAALRPEVQHPEHGQHRRAADLLRLGHHRGARPEAGAPARDRGRHRRDHPGRPGHRRVHRLPEAHHRPAAAAGASALDRLRHADLQRRRAWRRWASRRD